MTRQTASSAFGGGPSPQRPPRPRFFSARRPADLELAGVNGLSAAAVRRLATLELTTVGDLLNHAPRRYEEFSPRKPIADLRLGEEATIRATVEHLRSPRRTRHGRVILSVVMADESGKIEAVWFNQGYLERVLVPGTRVSLRGTYNRQAGRAQFLVKGYELIADEDEGAVHTEGVVAVYPQGEQVTSRLVRDTVSRLRPYIRGLPDPLPVRLRVERGLPTRAGALLGLHLPRSINEGLRARRRLVLDELLLMQLGLRLLKAERQRRAVAPPLPAAGELVSAFRAGLPFSLTAAQEQALAEIDTDLRQTVPMRRLLQGDVGSGKTVVALACLLRAAEAGYQGTLIAPTEVLVRQHVATAARLLGPLVPTEVLSASLTGSQRAAALGRIASGAARLVFGTHALLQEDVSFADLGVLVIDEQHRFGVEQRDELVRRVEVRGRAPHVLHMTATPIPRTLALTLFGDLDLTVIGERPPGRRDVETRLVSDAQREKAYEFVRGQVARGGQVYVVCPSIEDSASIDAAAAVAEAERLRQGPFRELRVGVAHGQLKASERDAVMDAFREGRLDVLVTTTLVETGLDVGAATVMIIEGAERFGLAQLHQLRGRVGRAAAKSYCLLLSRAAPGAAERRLDAMLETNDGFVLAERDLEIRGEGQVLGARQAGVPGLKLASLARDREVLAEARALADEILALDPTLSTAAMAPLRHAVEGAFGGELGWLLRL